MWQGGNTGILFKLTSIGRYHLRRKANFGQGGQKCRRIARSFHLAFLQIDGEGRGTRKGGKRQ